MKKIKGDKIRMATLHRVVRGGTFKLQFHEEMKYLILNTEGRAF